MAITEITINEWELKDDGRLIPRLHFTPVTIKGNVIGQVPGYSFRFIMERGLGVGATIFIDVRSPGRTGYISYVNVPAMPNAPQFCNCGRLLRPVKRHLQCIIEKEECPRRGIHSWLNSEPLDWIKLSIDDPERWTYFRDIPNYFKPRIA